jgi:hypothetical protein
LNIDLFESLDDAVASGFPDERQNRFRRPKLVFSLPHPVTAINRTSRAQARWRIRFAVS